MPVNTQMKVLVWKVAAVNADEGADVVIRDADGSAVEYGDRDAVEVDGFKSADG